MKITDVKFCEAISSSIDTPKKTVDIELEDKDFYNCCKYQMFFYYQGGPVDSCSKGWIGKIDEEYVIVNYGKHLKNEDNSDTKRNYVCKTIPDEYIEIIEKYVPQDIK